MDDLLLELEAGRGQTPVERDRKRRLGATVAICGLALVSIGQLTTGALFYDNASSSATKITSGTVQLGATVASAWVATDRMAPGDDYFATIDVNSSGSLQNKYDLTVSSSSGTAPSLAGALSVSIYTGLATCTKVTTGAAVAAYSAVTAASAVAWNDRVIDGATTEKLCVKFALPLATGNAYQGKDATYQFDFYTEQTANNP